MTSDWWPRPLAHIAAEDPWAGDQVVVAEVKSYDEQPHAGQRRTFSALVPIDEIEAVKANLAKLNHDVSTSGPQPFFSKDRAFCPRFWVGAQELPSDEYEPLVLCWISHDKTVLQLDPGFLMTYGLVQRPGKRGTVHWDDPRTPRHDIAIVSAPSVWTFPVGSHAYVSIAKDYLQDFLTLRHMALVQVFWEIRWGHLDDEMLAILEDNEGVNIDLPDRRYHLGRSMERTDSGFAQVWAARVIAMPGGLPVTADPLDDNGLVWPGFDRPITNEVSRSLGLNDYFYVDDTVLAAYEGTPGFKINPESGSVSYGNQWSVGGARVGRNLLRLEPKGLYEGAPPEAVRHWHEYAVAPIPMSAYPAILEVPNIASRAKKITYAVASLGEALSALAQKAGLDD